MARPLRIWFEGALYHVTARGNERKAIVRDDEDRQRFLDCLAVCVPHFEVRLLLFCLLDNHYHLVVETPQGNLSQFMQNLATRYVVYFNRRHRRSGHLLQGRFGATLVEEERYLLPLSRYVHLNPVRLRATRKLGWKEQLERLRDYRWSSYPTYIGTGRGLEFVSQEPLLEQVGGSGRGRRERYREYVETGLAQADEEFLAIKQASVRCLGSEEFRSEVEGRHEDLLKGRGWREDAAGRKPRKRAPVGAVEAAVREVTGLSRKGLKQRRKGGQERALLAHGLTRHAGLTQREAARVLGLSSGAAVSLQLRGLRRAVETDRHLQRQLATLDAHFLTIKDPISQNCAAAHFVAKP